MYQIKNKISNGQILETERYLPVFCYYIRSVLQSPGAMSAVSPETSTVHCNENRARIQKY